METIFGTFFTTKIVVTALFASLTAFLCSDNKPRGPVSIPFVVFHSVLSISWEDLGITALEASVFPHLIKCICETLTE